MVHRIREKGKKRSIFDKVKEIKNNLKLFLPELEEDRIIPILARCRRFYEGSLYYGRKTTNIEEKKNNLTLLQLIGGFYIQEFLRILKKN
jgi:hypothetical protein